MKSRPIVPYFFAIGKRENYFRLPTLWLFETRYTANGMVYGVDGLGNESSHYMEIVWCLQD